jgi:hypothetical protein
MFLPKKAFLIKKAVTGRRNTDNGREGKLPG